MVAMRRCLLLLLASAWMLAAAEPKTETIEGKLIVRQGAAAILETAGHQAIELSGDPSTQKVLHDERLNGMTAQATGHYIAPGKFLLDPQHKRALLVRKGETLKMITYWCEVCQLRSYTPGPCVCCQGETDLDLRNLDDIR